MDPFLGQLLLVPYNFAPRGYAFCQGQLLPIAQNTALFSLLGTQYGGDGRSTFALPNLQGSIAIGQGTSSVGQYTQGQTGGEQHHTLIQGEMALHAHTQQGTSAGAGTDSPAGGTFGSGVGRGKAIEYYVAGPPSPNLATLNATSLGVAGNGQPHANNMPGLGLNYIIALQGIFPSRQ
jgi:microcystin-dependent protein